LHLLQEIQGVRYDLCHSNFTTGVKNTSEKLFTVLQANEKILFCYLPLTLSVQEEEDKNKWKEKAVEKEM
jgi:5-carboxymethyl-2-hydroxymuconate isomerase